jgi:hypothetical protein
MWDDYELSARALSNGLMQNGFREALNKSLYRHAGDRFVWNESGRTQYARRVQTRDGLQLNRHPVNNCFHWIPACAGMTNILRRTLV